MGKRVILLIVGVLLVDQIVKILIKTQLHPLEQVSVIDGFFQLYYIENRGMAFGTTLGSGSLAKYALSIFRLVAIIGIGYYIYKLLKEKNVSKGLVYAVGFIFAGATGNLIDGMFYDYIWEVDPDIAWNWAKDADGQWVIDETGHPALRPTGFLLGSVVDMFQFTISWPENAPFGLKGEVFGAIWNVADASITVGVGIIIFKYRSFFRKESEKDAEPAQAISIPKDSPGADKIDWMDKKDDPTSEEDSPTAAQEEQ